MSRWAAEELKGLKMEVVVVDPRRVRLIAETRRKNDRAEARVLAELARTGALPRPLHLVSDEARQLQAQLGVRRGSTSIAYLNGSNSCAIIFAPRW